MVGHTLTHYRIVEKLGEGGMGVVWKALDTKLDREVAIKVLPDELARDSEHLARFEREAKLLATLNHRNIAAIYGIDEADGKRFLVMELVEGEDLRRHLDRGPMPVEEGLDVCHQLARALEAAHEKGVLHRDLKPANIQITPEGRVKVLDFGLAKSFEEQGDPSKSPTLTSAGTKAGTILGTAGYMSPEQARGKILDKRTDIWSFGCVLYECLTGKAPFAGETVSDTLASILKTEPNWAALPERTPPRVVELLQRCLDKDVRNRLRDVGDARIELQRSLAGRESLSDVSGVVPIAVETETPVRSSSKLILAAVLLVGAAVGAGAWTWLAPLLGSSGSGNAGVVRLSMSYPEDLDVGGLLLSPDGASVVFSGRPKDAPPEDPFKLYHRKLDRYGIDAIEGSDGVEVFSFSPDGLWVAMLTPVTPRSTKYRLSKVPLDGSAPPQALLDWPEEWNPSLLWLPDDDLLAITSEPRSVVRIPADGSPAKPPVEIRNVGFEGEFNLLPLGASVLPDGIHLLGVGITYTGGRYEQNAGVLNVKTGEARIVVANGNSPQWAGSGHLLFSRGDTLLGVPFDLETLATTGGQVAITDGLRADAIWEDAGFQISSTGTLLHWPGGLVGGSRKLMVLGRSCDVEGPWSDDHRPFEASLKVSEDGRRLAVTIVDAEGLYDVWVSDVDRPRLRQLVDRPGEDCVPQIWSPDGDRLVYGCGTTAGGTLWIGPGDGVGDARSLGEGSPGESFSANAFLGDSHLILSHFAGGESELLLLPLEPGDDGEHTPTRLLPDARNADLSPDGRWLTYLSDSSGRNEVYLREIRADRSLGPEIPVTTGGGGGPGWYTGEGAAPLEIHYFDRSRIWSVTVETRPRVRFSDPRAVSGDLREFLRTTRGGWAWLGDGRVITIVAGDDEAPPTEANVVLNWFDELETRMDSAR